MNSALLDMAFTASNVLRLYLLRIMEAMPTVLGAVALLLVFWFGGRYAAGWIGRAIARMGAEPHVVRLLERMVWYGFIGLGLVTALGTIGVDLTALVATLGVIGFAISFAFQDIFGNFLAGILLMLQRPFKIGDLVAVAGAEGIVEDIRIRDTVIRLEDGRVVIVPNKNILGGTIVNYTANPVLRVEVEVTSSNGATLDELRAQCVEVVAGVQEVAAKPAPAVLAGSVSGSTVSLIVRCWVDTSRRDFSGVRAAVVEALHKALPNATVKPR
ncbi:MAG TPA: mechanosensitive ion channel family protein [Limnochordales bacterium]